MNGNDAKEQAANTAHVHAVEQAAAQALVEEKESESRFRHYGKGPWAAAISALAVVFSLFQMYASTFSAFDAMTLRSWHIIFLLVLSFLMYPAWKGERRSRTRPTLFDALCIAAGLFSFGYLILNYTEITLRGGYFLPVDYFVASVGVIICFEMARRVVGSLAALAGVFFLYNFAGEWIPGAFGHTGFSWDRVVEHMFWGSQGLLGVGVGVSATYIFLFVLFGAFLKYSGFSDFINDLALTLIGRTAGGPAKVSVVASALMGMINGSALANVATTGAITIPLMKKTGYKPEFAAAVEAVASTGGQFAPPIMGAVGFIMAEFLGVPYTKVMLAAAIPAFLYYLTLLMAVHFEARKLGLKGLSPEHIPAAGKVLRERGHLFIPLIVLLWLMFDGYTPLFAAAASIFATVGATWLPSLIGLLRTKTARTFAFVLLLAVLGGLALSGLLSLGAAILTALCVLASAWCSARYRMTPRVVVQALDEGARGARGCGLCDHRHHHRHGIPHRTRPDLRVRGTQVRGRRPALPRRPVRHDHEHHPRHGRARRGGLCHRCGRGGPGAHGRGRDADGGAHVLLVLRLPLQHHAAGRHVVLCGGGHCAFGSDPHVPHCGKARPDRIHPALLFPEQPTPAVQLGQSGSGDAVGVRHGLSRGERAGRRVAGLAVRAL